MYHLQQHQHVTHSMILSSRHNKCRWNNWYQNEISSYVGICQEEYNFMHLNLERVNAPGGFKVPHGIFDELKHLINLEHLDFPVVDILHDDGNSMGDDFNFMANVVNNCKKLKHLNMGYAENFSQLEFEEISKLKYLEYLNLFDCTIDSQSFNKIARNCLELKKFETDFEYLPQTDLGKFQTLKKN